MAWLIDLQVTHANARFMLCFLYAVLELLLKMYVRRHPTQINTRVWKGYISNYTPGSRQEM